jgi:hypothetical protein
LRLSNRCLLHVQSKVDFHLSRKLEPIFIHIGDHDKARPCMTRDGCGHDSDGTRSRNENVFADNIVGKRCVNRISKGVEDRCGVSIDFRVVTPDVRHRQCDQFREASLAIHANPGRVRAQMTPSGHAVPTAAADDMALAGNQFARKKVIHVGTDRDDFANEFMPDDEWDFDGSARPLVPVVMWTSVPQIPVRRTRIRTSLMPMVGSATSRSERPFSARSFTRAFTESFLPLSAVFLTADYADVADYTDRSAQSATSA